ncbi:MAG: hypothetical protein HQM08_29300 [Candidatus Riflebacteria bacterium]|nr:hypothetical protein [Candidatus Riflebacteria bacterium]
MKNLLKHKILKLIVSSINTPIILSSKTKSPIRAFTVIEILISAAILSLLFFGVIGTFSSGSRSFQTGNWRVLAQKKAQVFLALLRENLEKVNNEVFVAASGVTTVNPMPLYLNNRWYGPAATCDVSQPVLYASIIVPYKSGQPDIYRLPEKGRWSGLSIICQNRKLTIKRTGSITDFNSPFPAQGRRADSTKFDDAGPEATVMSILEDVDSLQFSLIDNADGRSIKVNLVLRRYSNGLPTEAAISEEILAKLATKDQQVVGFVP